MPVVRLTQSYVNSLKPNPNKPLWVTDSITRNLKLYVGTSGVKVWYAYYYGLDGKRTSKKLGLAGDVITVAMARDMANELFARITKGEEPKKKRVRDDIPLREYLSDHYEPWVLTARRSGAQTMAMIRFSFASFLDTPINKISIHDMEKWRQDELSGGNKAASCNRQVSALKAALNWGVKGDHFKDNPLQRLEKLQEHDSDIKVRYLSPEERTRLNEALDARERRIRQERISHNKWLEERKKKPLPLLAGEFADHLKPMVLLSLNTGMRRGNLLALLWGDIDLERRAILLRGSASKSGKTLRLPINNAAITTLTAWKKQSVNTASSAFVFPSPKTGKKVDNVASSWEGLLEEAKIEGFRWHDMRHDFASKLVMKGVDLNTVRELLGHSDLKMTLRYAHLAPESALRAVELLDE